MCLIRLGFTHGPHHDREYVYGANMCTTCKQSQDIACTCDLSHDNACCRLCNIERTEELGSLEDFQTGCRLNNLRLKLHRVRHLMQFAGDCEQLQEALDQDHDVLRRKWNSNLLALYRPWCYGLNSYIRCQCIISLPAAFCALSFTATQRYQCTMSGTQTLRCCHLSPWAVSAAAWCCT